jgi:hypothetical protein
MRPSSNPLVFRLSVLILSSALFVAGCGGGGGTASDESSPPVSPAAPIILSWTPPQSFADQTPLDPARDLKDYEIFVNDVGTFSPGASPTALVSAVDPANGRITTSFDLSQLGNFLAANKTYYVSMRSVSITGERSDFSPSAAFSL